MTAVDHLFFLILAVVHPCAGFLSFRRLLRRIKAGEAVDRLNLYRVTMIGHWVLFVAALAIWYGSDREWPVLGFGLDPGTGLLAGAALTIIGIGFLVAQVRQIGTASTDDIRSMRGQLGPLEIIIPRNDHELRLFYGLSLTAGVVEETLWRGFMIWYLAQFMPLWAAAALSAAGFGIAHAYQGIANLPKITLVGAAFAALFLLTGSLWLPMLLHAAVDVLQGRTAFEIVRRSGADGVANTPS